MPKLTEYIYHSILARLLNKCRIERKNLTPGNINDLRDFSEKLAAAFDGEIQSEHWVNTIVTIEVSVIEEFLKSAVDAYLDGGGGGGSGGSRGGSSVGGADGSGGGGDSPRGEQGGSGGGARGHGGALSPLSGALAAADCDGDLDLPRVKRRRGSV